MRSKSAHVAKPAIIEGRLIITVARTMFLLSEFKKMAFDALKARISQKSQNGQTDNRALITGALLL